MGVLLQDLRKEVRERRKERRRGGEGGEEGKVMRVDHLGMHIYNTAD